MTAERLESIEVGPCPTCGGPAQFVQVDADVPLPTDATPEQLANMSAVVAVELPNVREDLGDEWSFEVRPRLPDNRWYAVASRTRLSNDGRPTGGLDFEYGFGNSPTAAYLALRSAIEGRS
jgi:hypothetical protein